jgi:hypothetical protein
LLILAIILGIAAKVISFLLLPESAYNDAIYHLNVIKEVVAQQTFSLNTDVPPPLFHAASAALFSFSGLAFYTFAIKLFPLVLLFLQLIFGFLLMRKIFPESPLPGFAFLVIYPWLTRFGGINYPEALAVVGVMASLLLLLKIREQKNSNPLYLLALAISISIISLSKLNGTILVPVFFLGALYVLWKNKNSAKSIATFAVIAILLSSFWFGLNLIKFGQFDQHLKGDVTNFGEGTGFSLQSIASNMHLYYIYFFDFPAEAAFSSVSFLAGIDAAIPAIVFAIIVLPLLALMLFGAKKLSEKDKFLALLIFSALLLALIPIVQRTAYYRLIIPAVPMLAILFGYGFNAVKGHLKTIALVSLVLFAVYSFAYTSYSAYQFNNALSPNDLLYEKISELPSDAKILISANRSRDVEFFAGRTSLGADTGTPEFLVSDAGKFYDVVKKAGVTDIAVVCYKDPFNKEVLQQLQQENKISVIFSKDCSQLYEVN